MTSAIVATFDYHRAGVLFPSGFTVDYNGESRQYAKQSNALLITFFLALIIQSKNSSFGKLENRYTA